MGPDFETIQNNYRIGNLPQDWQTTDWPSILVLCRDYYNLVKPQGLKKRDLGFSPRRLISDFDTKLIGGKAREYLNSLKIHINAAPANCQDPNGLAECHWQTMVAMARGWLTSAQLPATFWYYAVKRAAKICNYFPIKLENGTWSTPLDLAHESKPDLRVLFQMFGLAAVHRERIGDSTLGKFTSQSIPMIAVGRCPNSTGLLFYNPVNSTLSLRSIISFSHIQRQISIGNIFLSTG